MQKKTIGKRIILVFLLTSFSLMNSVARGQDKAVLAAHVLMPVYNAKQYILGSIQSVLNQDYGNLKLLILNDGSNDGTLDTIQQYLQENPSLKDKVYVASIKNNQGVQQTRVRLLEWSKKLDPTAYLFWLDSDDKYTDKNFVKAVIDKMKETNAEICLFNFSIVYEDESQKNNAAGLLKEKEVIPEIINTILSFPTQSAAPLEISNLLRFTSLGWTKAYAPTVKLPIPDNCPFEDFVYMAALLNANRITALPAKREPIEHLRRSTSICGKRMSKNFTHDIPAQLMRFFKIILEDNQTKKERLQQLKMAQNFVSRKLEQYTATLTKIVETKSYAGIDQKTLYVYRKKSAELEKIMQEAINHIEAKGVKS